MCVLSLTAHFADEVCFYRVIFADCAFLPESVFAESVRFCRVSFAESVLLSQLFADAARIVVDRQFIDVNIERGGTA